METIRIWIVADDPLVRAGLVMLMSDLPNCEIAGQGSSQQLLTDLAEEDLNGDELQVIIWDAGWEMPELIPDWQEVDLPVIALLPDANETARVWSSGVRGLLSREADAESLAAALQTAVNGLIVLDEEIAQQLLPESNHLLVPDPALDLLTDREEEVLQLVAEGLTNKAIARKLHISNHTVKFHINSIMTKLGAQSRTEAVVQATRQGLILL